jgi:hypothetical protein
MQSQPVDNNTYNLIEALAETLEACEPYKKYAKDGNRQLWDDLLQRAEGHVQLLQQELSRVIGTSQGAAMSARQQDMGSKHPDPFTTQTAASGTVDVNQDTVEPPERY